MSASSDADRNLLFGVLALQVDLIDARQFAEICTAWSARKEVSLAELLVQRGWLTPEDRADVERLLHRKLRKHGDARASLDAVRAEADVVCRSVVGWPAAPDHLLVSTIALQSTDLDRYSVTSLYKKGGIGQVSMARDRQLGRYVALKELLPGRDDPRTVARFLQEAQVTGQLEHPGIVPVYELARWPGGEPYYTMRFVKGRTLTEAAKTYHEKRRAGREEAFALPALLNAFVTICNTVAYAHSRGVLHRDLKGQNVLLGDFGEVIVLDWGLAKLLGGTEGESALEPVEIGREARSSETIPGEAMGTPAYMAPEQAAGRLELISERTDVYGLGAILYEVLAGQPPFTSRDVLDVLRQVREEEPLPPREVWPQVPPGLEAICLKALAKDQAARWASAKELGQQVQGWQDDQRRQAEERYRTLAEAVPHIIWTATPTGLTDYINRRGSEYSGMALGEAMGSGWQGKVHSDDLPEALRRWQRSLSTGEDFEVEYRLLRSDGVYRWNLVRAVPVRDSEGRIIKWFGTCTDIDDQKRAEEELRRSQEALRQSEALHRSILDTIPHSVWTARQDGRLDHANRWGLDHFGQTAEQGLGDGWHQIVHPDDLPATQERWARALATGESYEVEFRLRVGDGHRWFLSRAVPVRDADGRIVKWYGTCTDIEDQKRVEEALRDSQAALRQSETMYRAIINSIPQIVWTTGPDGQPDFYSRQAFDYTGVTPEEVDGNIMQRVVHPEDLPGATEIWLRSLADGLGHESRYRIRRADGVYRWHLSRAVPIRDGEGRIVKWFGTATDIDDQARAARPERGGGS
jgi:PAS domain S-box-containing protein